MECCRAQAGRIPLAEYREEEEPRGLSSGRWTYTIATVAVSDRKAPGPRCNKSLETWRFPRGLNRRPVRKIVLLCETNHWQKRRCELLQVSGWRGRTQWEPRANTLNPRSIEQMDDKPHRRTIPTALEDFRGTSLIRNHPPPRNLQ